MINHNNGLSKRTSARYNNTDEFRPGPFEAEVVNHLDTTYMGGLEVRLLTKTGAGDSIDTPGETFAVKYLSPFYGVTPSKGITGNAGHENTQKSYGMWFVPPDVGTKVLVIFTESGQGYWIGCIQDEYMNMMLPGSIPATSYNDDGEVLPVAEYNKKVEDGSGRDTTQFIKPVNTPAKDILKEQGLDKCYFRGLTTSSARRELPSSVFGISTPGPHDFEGPKVKYGGDFATIDVPHNRLGGSCLVFDDGDSRFQRKQHAKDGPPEYADVDAGDSGDPKIPHNELIRLRTRTGHQILLHNSEDLIYICNSRGTAWIEMTSKGKIDIFTEEDVSVGAGRDINLKADRNIHIEADEDIHIKAHKNIYQESLETFHITSNEEMYINAILDAHVKFEKDAYIEGKEFLEIRSDGDIWFLSDATLEITAENDLKVEIGGETSLKSSGSLSFNTERGLYMESSESSHLKSGNSMHLDASKAAHINSDDVFLTSGKKMEVNAGKGGLFSGEEMEFKADNVIVLDGGSSVDFATPQSQFGGKIIGPKPTGSANVSGVDSAKKAKSAEGSDISPTNAPIEVEEATEAKGSPRIPRKEPWDEHENLHGEDPPEIPDTFRKGT